MMLARPFRRRRVKESQVYMKANTTAVTRPRQDNGIYWQVDAEALMKSFHLRDRLFPDWLATTDIEYW